MSKLLYIVNLLHWKGFQICLLRKKW